MILISPYEAMGPQERCQACDRTATYLLEVRRKGAAMVQELRFCEACLVALYEAASLALTGAAKQKNARKGRSGPERRRYLGL